MKDRSLERGSALITVLMLIALLSALLTAYYMVTRVELSTTQSSMNSTRGFYAAEAGVNLRVQEIRQEFKNYQRPSGTPPVVLAGQLPCAGDQGVGDFRCQTRPIGGRDVSTYVTEAIGNPTIARIPAGERHENLNAQEYAYSILSVAETGDGRAEAILGMDFTNRLVPMFQFAAFYNKDLEIHPGPPMNLAGPVHSNGDLYLGSSGGLTIGGQVTTAGDLYHGRKTDMTCYGGGVIVPDPATPTPFPVCPTASTEHYLQPMLDSGWNGNIRTGIDSLVVPPPEAFDPGEFYWDRADLRVVLKIEPDGVTTSIELRNVDETPDIAGSATLTGCGPVGDRAVDTSNTFVNLREGKPIQMLDVNVRRLLDCLQTNSALMGGKTLDETSDGGLVWFLTVDGPDSPGINGYGIRLQNGGQVASTIPAAPAVAGLTVISNQAAYVHGDFNAAGWVPAAVMADSINVLSNAYVDGDHTFALGDPNRDASTTTINAAFLAGTDITGGVEGPGGQNGDYNGGLENYPRLHERWSGVSLVYRGSFVSLNAPRHVNGPHTTPDLYSPPIRDWGYDLQFNNMANLPPLTPQFVYVKQDMFIREFGL